MKSFRGRRDRSIHGESSRRRRESASSFSPSAAGDAHSDYNHDAELSIDKEDEYDARFTKANFIGSVAFLQFNPVWKFILMVLIVATFGISLYELSFMAAPSLSDDSWLTEYWEVIVRYACYIFYFVDTVCAIIHAKHRKVASLRPYLPRSNWIILVDVVTLMPLDFILDSQAMRAYLSRTAVVTMTLVRCVRIYRAALYIQELNKSVGLKPWFILVVSFTTYYLLALHTLTCVWFILSSGIAGDWTTNSELMANVQPERPRVWYLLCFYLILVTMTTGYGDIIPYTVLEYWVIAFSMLTGFAISGLLDGALIDLLVQRYRRHSDLWNKLRLIEFDLTTCYEEIPPSLLKKVRMFYKTFWEQRRAVKSSPLLATLPPQMVVEVETDIYWKALGQSRLLRGLTMSHKREIAKVMRSECYTMGEVILRNGELKDKLMFVVRGAIQILSKEDSESPLISLSSGTCLGETSLFLSYVSMVEINAVTYCELQFLDKRNLMEVISLHPQIGHEIKKVHCEQLTRSLLDVKARQKEEIWYAKGVGALRALKELKVALRQRIEKEVFQFAWMSDEELNERDQKSDDGRQAEETVKTYKEEILDQYRLSTTGKLESDDVCFRTRMPWVFNPDSKALATWNSIILLVVIMVSVLIPYYIGYRRTPPLWVNGLLVLMDVCYWMDLYVQLFTTFRVRGEFTTSVSQIMFTNMKKVTFIVDVAATIPLGLITYGLGIISDSRISQGLRLNRLLKIHILFSVFLKLQNGSLWNNHFLRVSKYILMLLLGSFWMGALFYMQACFDGDCTGSWMDLTEPGEDTFAASFYFAAVTITGTGYGDLSPVTFREVNLVIAFLFIKIMLYSFLVSDFSGLLIIDEMSRLDFKAKGFAIRRFLSVNLMQATIQNRVKNFLSLHWDYGKGHSVINENDIYSDAPKEIENSIKIWFRKCFFVSMDLFKECNPNMLAEICLEAESYTLPPNETITYAGEMCREFYVIEQGFCETSSNMWNDVGFIGPFTSFDESEMMLGVPSYHTVKTVTHCKLLRMTHTKLKAILKKYPDERALLTKLVQEHSASHRGLAKWAKQRTMSRRNTKSVKVDDPSWIFHKVSTKHHPNRDYDEPFNKLNTFSNVRYLLMRRTIHPGGRFLLCYEIVRCILALVAGFVFPVADLFLKQNQDSPLLYLRWFLDTAAVIDLYVRMHVCYYNKNGLLVTHPLYTCKHYISHGFAIDVAACFPISYGFSDESSYSNWSLIHLILKCNRCLQIHRLSYLIHHFEDNILIAAKFNKLFYFIPITFIIFNILALLYEVVNCWHDELDELRCFGDTWFEDRQGTFKYDISQPFNFHITVVYFVAMTILNVGLGDLYPTTSGEQLLVLGMILFGYLVFTYMTVRIASGLTIYNKNLVLYQQHMNSLALFTKREKISAYLSRELKEHFENVWIKMRGLTLHKMFSSFHIQLREDIAMDLYEETLSGNALFRDVERSFFRRLFALTKEHYFVKGGDIVSLHDIVTNMYIIHQGELNVYDLTGELRLVLARGHVFGNLEKQRGIRSTIPIVAATNVNLLVVSSEKFFQLVEVYPLLLSRFSGRSSEEVMLYSCSKKTRAIFDPTLATTSVVEMSPFLLAFIKVAQTLLMVCSYLSVMLIMYQLAFQYHEIPLTVVNVSLDVIVAMRIILGFVSPFQNKIGDYVHDPVEIRKKYLTIYLGFWFDVAINLPWALLALTAPYQDQMYVFSWIRTIHLLRILYVVKFFNIRYEQLNISLFKYKLSGILLWMFLLLHMSACLWYMVPCPRAVCNRDSWAMHMAPICNSSYYTCSIYYSVQMFSTMGMGNIKPYLIEEVILTIVLLVLSRFSIALFIGDMSTIVANYSLTLVNYDFKTKTLQHYLENNPICQPLVDKVLYYVQQMWNRERGHSDTRFLKKTPRYLLEKLNIEAYGRHLYENPIFANCESDFIRQLIVHMRRITFFSGDYVVQQGDMDNTLYFVHVGQVEVIAVGESTLELVDILSVNDTFGLRQGLNVNVPHDYTYRSTATSVILSLKYEDWAYLIPYFPSARRDIESRMNALLLPIIRI